MSFGMDKQQALGGVDKSKKGSLDEGIREVVDAINSFDDYYTTSSCAGRTVCLCLKTKRKIDSEWLYADHDVADFTRMKSALSLSQSSPHDVWIKQESAILHVCCSTLEAADTLCKAAKEAGFKRAGIVNLTPRIMVEIFGNERVEVRVVRKGKLLVEDSFLQEIVDECNEKMTLNKMHIQRLLEKVKAL